MAGRRDAGEGGRLVHAPHLDQTVGVDRDQLAAIGRERQGHRRFHSRGQHHFGNQGSSIPDANQPILAGTGDEASVRTRCDTKHLPLVALPAFAQDTH